MHKVKLQTSTIAKKLNKRKRSNVGTTNVQRAINDHDKGLHPAQFAIIADGGRGTSGSAEDMTLIDSPPHIHFAMRQMRRSGAPNCAW